MATSVIPDTLNSSELKNIRGLIPKSSAAVITTGEGNHALIISVCGAAGGLQGVWAAVGYYTGTTRKHVAPIDVASYSSSISVTATDTGYTIANNHSSNAVRFSVLVLIDSGNEVDVTMQ